MEFGLRPWAITAYGASSRKRGGNDIGSSCRASPNYDDSGKRRSERVDYYTRHL